jgi:hypothetical protein
VTTSIIADGAVTATQLAPGSIGTSALAGKSVTTSIIADGAVTATQLAAGAVTAASFAQGTFSAGPGLVVSGTEFSASLLPAGGRNGTATTVARSDHTHQIIVPVGVNDFGQEFGTPVLTKVSYGALPVPGWTLPQAANGTCIIASSVIPPGIALPPALVVEVQAAAAGIAVVLVDFTGVAASAAPPGCVNSVSKQSLTFSAVNTMQRFSVSTLGTLSVCGSSPPAVAGPGDILAFRVCNEGAAGAIDFTVTSAHLVWN